MTRDSSVSNSAWQKFTQLLPVKSSDKEKLHNTKITEMSCTGLSKAHVDCITGLAHVNSSMLAGAFHRSSLTCRTTSQKKIGACSSGRCILGKMNTHCIWFGQCAKKNTYENLIPPSVSGLSRQHHARCHVVEGGGVGRKFVSRHVEGCRGMLDLEARPIVTGFPLQAGGLAANSGFLKLSWKGYEFVRFCAHLLMSSIETKLAGWSRWDSFVFCLRSPGNIQCPRGACACQLVEKGQHEQLVIRDLLPIKTHHARPMGCHSLPATGAEPQCKATSASSESSKKAFELGEWNQIEDSYNTLEYWPMTLTSWPTSDQPYTKVQKICHKKIQKRRCDQCHCGHVKCETLWGPLETHNFTLASTKRETWSGPAVVVHWIDPKPGQHLSKALKLKKKNKLQYILIYIYIQKYTI